MLFKSKSMTAVLLPIFIQTSSYFTISPIFAYDKKHASHFRTRAWGVKMPQAMLIRRIRRLATIRRRPHHAPWIRTASEQGVCRGRWKCSWISCRGACNELHVSNNASHLTSNANIGWKLKFIYCLCIRCAFFSALSDKFVDEIEMYITM